MKIESLIALHRSGCTSLAHLMFLIALDEPRAIGEAAERCKLRFSTASRVCHMLEVNGYVKTSSLETDRRVSLVSRTAKASKLFTE